VLTAVALREIRRYQKSTDLLIPKRSFYRLCQEITTEIVQKNTSSPSSIRWKPEALSAVQEACEAYIVQMFEGMCRVITMITIS
jgi:histone H3